MHALYFTDQTVVFDDRVEVVVPPEAEDSMNVPVGVHFPALAEQAEEVLVFIDYNPIPKVLRYYPEQTGAYLGFKIKLQQASPIRAAVRTQDGIWHLAGAWVDAAGGGCTLPSNTRSSIDEDAIGELHGRLWRREDDSQRLRFHIVHPMDTGLVSGIPAFFVEELNIEDTRGNRLGRLKTFEPISENPIISLDINVPADTGPIRISGRDNNGLRIEAELP
jgi:sulfur-oxidizing protein SoxY